MLSLLSLVLISAVQEPNSPTLYRPVKNQLHQALVARVQRQYAQFQQLQSQATETKNTPPKKQSAKQKKQTTGSTSKKTQQLLKQPKKVQPKVELTKSTQSLKQQPQKTQPRKSQPQKEQLGPIQPRKLQSPKEQLKKEHPKKTQTSKEQPKIFPSKAIKISNAQPPKVQPSIKVLPKVRQATQYSVGGIVAGLTGTVKIQMNGRDTLTINANKRFRFANTMASGRPYVVTISSSPMDQICSVSKGNSIMGNAHVTDIRVRCSKKSYTLQGSVTGLNASGLVLQVNGANDLSVPQHAPSFAFPELLAHGGGYSVSVYKQPIGLTCAINNGVGSNLTANVEDVEVLCDVNQYKVGGSISGLNSQGLVLQNNDNDAIIAKPNERSFEFTVTQGGNYNISITHQPNGLLCTVANGEGKNVGVDVNEIAVNCKEILYISSASNTVSKCSVQENGDLENCTPTASEFGGFNNPLKIAIHPNRASAYVANGNHAVSKCTIDPTDGEWSQCDAETGGGVWYPIGVAINPTGNMAYITDHDWNLVSSCTMDEGGKFTHCVDLEDDILLTPVDITIHPTGTFAYIANSGNASITKCNIELDGSLKGCEATAQDTYPVGISTHIPTAIAFHPQMPIVYIANKDDGTVTQCQIDNTGDFTNCTLMNHLGFVDAADLIINAKGTIAYIASPSSGVIKCNIDTATGNLTSCASSGSNVDAPNGLAMLP